MKKSFMLYRVTGGSKLTVQDLKNRNFFDDKEKIRKGVDIESIASKGDMLYFDICCEEEIGPFEIAKDNKFENTTIKIVGRYEVIYLGEYLLIQIRGDNEEILRDIKNYLRDWFKLYTEGPLSLYSVVNNPKFYDKKKTKGHLSGLEVNPTQGKRRAEKVKVTGTDLGKTRDIEYFEKDKKVRIRYRNKNMTVELHDRGRTNGGTITIYYGKVSREDLMKELKKVIEKDIEPHLDKGLLKYFKSFSDRYS